MKMSDQQKLEQLSTGFYIMVPYTKNLQFKSEMIGIIQTKIQLSQQMNKCIIQTIPIMIMTSQAQVQKILPTIIVKELNLQMNGSRMMMISVKLMKMNYTLEIWKLY